MKVVYQIPVTEHRKGVIPMITIPKASFAPMLKMEDAPVWKEKKSALESLMLTAVFPKVTASNTTVCYDYETQET
jgi:hypothetical protein